MANALKIDCSGEVIENASNDQSEGDDQYRKVSALLSYFVETAHCDSLLCWGWGSVTPMHR